MNQMGEIGVRGEELAINATDRSIYYVYILWSIYYVCTYFVCTEAGTQQVVDLNDCQVYWVLTSMSQSV